MISLSTSLKRQILIAGGSSFASAINGGKIFVFGGPIPANADAAATNAVPLCVVTNNGDGTTGLTFGSPTNGILPQNSSESWECLAANVTSGTATFYRFCVGTDDGTTASIETDAKYRIQGTIGTDSSFDMTVASIALGGNNFGPITSYEIAI